MTFSELIQSDTPVLVDFHAVWCGPCKIMEPILKEVASKMDGKVKVVKVDVDQNPMAANAYQIQGVPTMILFKNGETVWRQAGVVPAHALIPILEQKIN